MVGVPVQSNVAVTDGHFSEQQRHSNVGPTHLGLVRDGCRPNAEYGGFTGRCLPQCLCTSERTFGQQRSQAGEPGPLKQASQAARVQSSNLHQLPGVAVFLTNPTKPSAQDSRQIIRLDSSRYNE